MQSKQPRPTPDHPWVVLTFFKRLAAELERRAPEFIAGMAMDDVVLRLSQAGLPKANRCYEFMQKLSREGWYDFTDDTISVLLTAPSIHQAVWFMRMQTWAKENWTQPPLEQGQHVRYGRQVGELYLDDTTRAMAAGYFRDDNWRKQHGDQGGILVFWENLVVLESEQERAA